MASLAQMQTWLSEAESARHQVAMGQGVTEIWRDGRRLTFTKSNLSDLDSYIKRLEQEIEKAEAVAAGGARRSAIRFDYGG